MLKSIGRSREDEKRKRQRKEKEEIAKRLGERDLCSHEDEFKGSIGCCD